MKIKSLAIVTALTLSLSGCALGTPVATPEPTPTIEPSVRIVASTNVWGDISSSIGGDLVEVVSIIDSFGQDPHSYEASARDQLAVSEADLVIANGGGYDSFVEVLAKAADDKEILFAYQPEELDSEEAKDEDGHNHEADHGNEHVWYDFHVVEDFANRLAGKLAALDPENASVYGDNLVLFLYEIEILEDRSAELSLKIDGSTVLSSEPVADYLLDELGLENLTPSSFSQAIEEELDLPPKVLLEIQNLLNSKTVDLFVVNLQTGSTQIDQLVSLAAKNNIAVIELSELLPTGIRYFEWMSDNLVLIEASLR